MEEKAPDDSNATIACDDVTKFMQVEEFQPMVVVPKMLVVTRSFHGLLSCPCSKKGLYQVSVVVQILPS